MTREQWEAIKNRDKNYDGVFFYGLKTTHHICRPSCTSRLCNPKNVIIFKSVEEGIMKGYTPCLKCRPEQIEWRGNKRELVEKAIEMIKLNYREKFKLSEIAGELFVNESYLLRIFKEITGYTMLEYHNLIRCEAAKELLINNELSISYISDSVGYISSSHFARRFKKLYGITPLQYRKEYLRSLN